jgi:peptide-methionine (R)-S-oxide reductase
MKDWMNVNLGRGEFLKYGALALGIALVDLESLYGTVRAAESPASKAGAGGLQQTIKVYSAQRKGFIMTEKVKKTDAEWKNLLTPEQFQVTRKKGTEREFSGAYWNAKEKGIYQCVCCGNDLYDSDTKYDSGTGWPSFWAPVAKENIRTEEDNSFFSKRTEVLCSRCDAHLGHVFNDGPKPSGLRYCMNSASLKFVKAG